MLYLCPDRVCRSDVSIVLDMTRGWVFLCGFFIYFFIDFYMYDMTMFLRPGVTMHGLDRTVKSSCWLTYLGCWWLRGTVSRYYRFWCQSVVSLYVSQLGTDIYQQQQQQQKKNTVACNTGFLSRKCRKRLHIPKSHLLLLVERKTSRLTKWTYADDNDSDKCHSQYLSP